jgi:hypothetical protein
MAWRKSSGVPTPGFGELLCGGPHDNYREPMDDPSRYQLHTAQNRLPDSCAWKLSEIEQIRDRPQSYSVRMKKSELTLKQVSAIPCPTCGVAVGMPCVLHSGGKRLEPHVDRKLAAIEALEGNAICSGQQYYFFASSPLK